MATIKRKRGRPRRVELTDDFDINLIQEFEKRPDLYDRNAPMSKDKAYIDELWEELSHCLGYDVSIVKDRMVQIRNKYHLEKKRLETLRTDNPKSNAESKWPLYEQLSFLSDHIPIRRSFRTMRCKRKYSESEYVIKSEADTEGSDPERERDYEYRPGRKEQIPYNRSFGSHTQTRNIGSTPAIRTATFPRLTRFPPQIYPSRHNQSVYNRKPFNSDGPHQTGIDKFHAFGQFLTSSLVEMPESDALLLIDQFTSALVQTYLEKPAETSESTTKNPDSAKTPNNCNGNENLMITE